MPTLSTRVSDGEFRAITEYANVTEVTIRNRYKGLKELLNL